MLLALAMCAMCACNDEEEPSILDALKISAWVMEQSLVGTGYWEYVEKVKNNGRWVSDDGTEVDSDEVFEFDRLELGVPRVMAPMGYNYEYNLNLRFECDGIVEVETDPPDDATIRINYSPSSPDAVLLGDITRRNRVKVRAPITVNVLPSGKFTNDSGNMVTPFTLTEREYFLNVRTYDMTDRQIISARLRLTVLDDPHFPYWEFSNWSFASGEVKSRFVEVELVEYEYSDQYKLDEYYGMR